MCAIPLSRTDPEHIAQGLTAFVNANIMAPSHPIQADDAFETAGVDSMAMLKLLLFIEAEFGFWVPDEDLVQENIASPRALANYLCRRLSA
jgi:acyl carrier protein